MTSDFNFQKAREAWGDKVVAPTHRVFQEWLHNPLTKALKQSHKNEIDDRYNEDTELLRKCLDALEMYITMDTVDEAHLLEVDIAPKVIAALKERLK